VRGGLRSPRTRRAELLLPSLFVYTDCEEPQHQRCFPENALSRPDVREAGTLLRNWARKGSMITAACIGTFVLGESGLLDQQRATTTWWLSPLFRKRYPEVRLEESNMIVTSGRFVTAGAALGHMTLPFGWCAARVHNWLP
jgi:transcriptional regulator GlxA family with amidase domain